MQRRTNKASPANMSSSFYILHFLLVIAQMALASFPTAAIEGEPAVAVAPEPIAQVPVATAHVAPAVAPLPAVAPAPYFPYYPHMYPYSMYAPYYHPRTEVRNVVKAYEKETGHRSETSMVSEAGHITSALGIHPAEHFSDALALPVPFRSHLRSQKLAKKASRAHKSFDKNKN